MSDSPPGGDDAKAGAGGAASAGVERLSDELVLLILDQLAPHEVLAGPARTCRRWAELAERRALHVRRRADLPRVHAGLRALLVTARLHALHEPLALARRLRHLAVHAGHPLADTELAALRRLPHLVHLDVFLRSRVLDERLLPAAERLAELVVNETCAPGLLRSLSAARRLRALHMFGRAQHYPRRDLLALLAARRDYLTALTLRCAELNDRAYAAVGACPNLTSLQLYSCWQLTPDAAPHVTRPPRLRCLHVTGARMLRPHALTAWLRALPPALLELNLSATWFGDQHVPELAGRLPGLRTLELWRCRVTARGLLALAAALPQLQEMDTDLPLPARSLAALRAHPALERLRCIPLPPPIPLAETGVALSKPTGSSSTTEPPTSTDFAEPTKSAETIDSTKQADSAEPADSTELIDSAEPADSADPSDSAEPSDSNESANSAESAEPTKPADSADAAGQLRVLAADAVYARGYLRGGYEGLRADLFYFWTQGVELELATKPEASSSFSSSEDGLDDITWFKTLDAPSHVKRRKQTALFQNYT